MIIVTGSARARPDTIDEAVDLSLQHVRRSRLEHGCLLHSVHRDVEDPHRLVFVEHWSNLDALRAHFALPESRAFSRAVTALADESSIEIFEAEPIRV